MTPRSCCTRCRDLHLRCVIKEGAQSCEHCAKKKRECIPNSNYRFKVVRSVPRRRYGDRSKVYFVYSPSQPWVTTPATVDFVTDSCGLPGDCGDSLVPEHTPPCSPSTPSLSFGPSNSINGADAVPCHTPGRLSVGLAEEKAISGLVRLSDWSCSVQTSLGCELSDSRHMEEQETESHADQALTFESCGLPSSPLLDFSSSVSSLPFDSHATQSPSLGQSPSPICLSDHEARLVRHWIDNLSPWADAGDPRNHFATVVPQRAMYHSTLRLALLAVSSKHMSLLSLCDRDDGSQYYDECISHLIPAISQVEESGDENVLVATILLRMYEEFSVEDNRCHLLGITRLVESVTKFLSSGGLGEAASWVVLRQVIYITLASKEAISIRLGNFKQSSSFLKRDEYSWSNIMTLLLTKVLCMAFAPQDSISAEDWRRLDAEIDEWDTSKPDTFKPLTVRQSKLESRNVFPEIWMLGICQVVAMQHFHVAKIFIKIYEPLQAKPGFEMFKAYAKKEDSIIEHLRAIIGLTLGNPRVPCAWLTTSHTLACCGCYLRRPKERAMVLDLLRDVPRTLGWQNQSVVSTLEHQWSERDKDLVR